LRRRNGFVYHRKVKPTKGTARIYLNCPNQGKRLKPEVGLTCPICGIRLRTRIRAPKTSKEAVKISNLCYKPLGRRGGHPEARRFLIERVPEIRERLASILTYEVFRRAEKRLRKEKA